MTNIEITSTGYAGEPDYFRSEGRAYQTINYCIQSFEDLFTKFSTLREEAGKIGRRRIVCRTYCKDEVAQEAVVRKLPVEVLLPLNFISNKLTGTILMIGENFHKSEVPEWNEVYSYWKEPLVNNTAPLQRLEKLSNNFCLTSNLSENDLLDLTFLWKPFGWTEKGVRQFINNYKQQSNLWFSGIRDNRTKKIVSACMGEGLNFADIFLIEGTEYSTNPNYENNGFCASSIIGLYAQILNNTLYKNNNIINGFPVIVAELNMSSRVDIVARKTGMTIPLVEGNTELTTPIQVLKRNVSILDRHKPNDLSWRKLSEDDRNHLREAYKTNFRYWRNFIFGVLPQYNIEKYYSQEQVIQILNYFQK